MPNSATHALRSRQEGTRTAVRHSEPAPVGAGATHEAPPRPPELRRRRTWPVILAKLSFVILLSSDLSFFWACSSAGSSVRVAPICRGGGGPRRGRETCQMPPERPAGAASRAATLPRLSSCPLPHPLPVGPPVSPCRPSQGGCHTRPPTHPPCTRSPSCAAPTWGQTCQACRACPGVDHRACRRRPGDASMVSKRC